jgi:hypothetical protein
MISVVPEEGEEDKNMESYGEEGYEHEYNGEYKDTEGEEAPLNAPQQTRTTREGKKKATDSIKILAHPSLRSNGNSGASRAVSCRGTRPLGG